VFVCSPCLIYETRKPDAKKGREEIEKRQREPGDAIQLTVYRTHNIAVGRRE
jgi:hypothetical protein